MVEASRFCRFPAQFLALMGGVMTNSILHVTTL